MSIVFDRAWRVISVESYDEPLAPTTPIGLLVIACGFVICLDKVPAPQSQLLPVPPPKDGSCRVRRWQGHLKEKSR